MTVIKEYTGQLMGGPDNGNLVTSSVDRIPTVSTIALWLDGRKEGATVDIIITTGTYIWNNEQGHFLWQLTESEIQSRPALEA